MTTKKTAAKKTAKASAPKAAPRTGRKQAQPYKVGELVWTATRGLAQIEKITHWKLDGKRQIALHIRDNLGREHRAGPGDVTRDMPDNYNETRARLILWRLIHTPTRIGSRN